MKHAVESKFSENQWDCQNDTKLFYSLSGVGIFLHHEIFEKMICNLDFKTQYGKMIYFAISFLLWDIEYH